MPPKRKRTERCLVCGKDQTEDPVGSAAISWLLCGVCKKWTHIQCYESVTSTESALTEGLWDFLHANETILDTWNFSCSSCIDAARSIPEQLETQDLLTRQQLIDLEVDPRFLSTEVKTVDPSMDTDPGLLGIGTDAAVDTGPVDNTGPVVTGPVGMVPSTNTGTGLENVVPPASVSTQNLDFPTMFQFMQAQMQMMTQMMAQTTQLIQQHKEERAENERTRKEEKEEDKRERMRLEAKHDMELAQKDQASRDELRRQGKEIKERLKEELEFKIGDGAPKALANKSKSGLKLPTLQLPHFNGDPLKWMEFWDMFQATVHQDADLSPVQKLSYLKANLEGPAQQSIAQLIMTNDNYDVAIELLKKRYGDKNVIRDKLFFQLRTLPSATMRLEDLRRTFHAVEQSLAQLKNVDEDFKNGMDREKFLLDIVMKKFPPHLLIEMKKWHQKEWTFDSFMDRLEYFIALQEEEAGLKTEIYGQTPGRSPLASHQKQPPKPSLEFQRIRSSADSLASISSGDSGYKAGMGKPRRCVFCDSDQHISEMCLKFPTEKQRRDLILRSQKCFICLRFGHNRHQCTNPIKQKPCSGCSEIGVHHRALCGKWFSKLLKPNNTSAGAKGMETPRNVETEVKQVGVTSVSDPALKNKSLDNKPVKKRVILQVAVLELEDFGRNKTTKVNALFDTACTNSWLVEDKAREIGLHLNGGKKRTISVSTFGRNEPVEVQGYESQVFVVLPDMTNHNTWTGNDNPVCIPVTVTSRILGHPLHRDVLSKTDWQFLHNRGFIKKLARGQVSEEPMYIDMVIGQDAIWDFLRPCYDVGIRNVDLPSGIKLIPSEIGYLLGGSTFNVENCAPREDWTAYLEKLEQEKAEDAYLNDPVNVWDPKTFLGGIYQKDCEEVRIRFEKALAQKNSDENPWDMEDCTKTIGNPEENVDITPWEHQTQKDGKDLECSAPFTQNRRLPQINGPRSQENESGGVCVPEFSCATVVLTDSGGDCSMESGVRYGGSNGDLPWFTESSRSNVPESRTEQQTYRRFPHKKDRGRRVERDCGEIMVHSNPEMAIESYGCLGDGQSIGSAIHVDKQVAGSKFKPRTSEVDVIESSPMMVKSSSSERLLIQDQPQPPGRFKRWNNKFN